MFRDKATVQVGSAEVYDNALTFNGCSNAVVYEVCNADGTVKVAFDACNRDHTPITSFFLNRINVYLPGGITANWADGDKLYAVQYDGSRKEISVTIGEGGGDDKKKD